MRRDQKFRERFADSRLGLLDRQSPDLNSARERQISPAMIVNAGRLVVEFFRIGLRYPDYVARPKAIDAAGAGLG